MLRHALNGLAKRTQHIATGWPNVRNMLCPTMLQDVALKCCERLARLFTLVSILVPSRLTAPGSSGMPFTKASLSCFIGSKGQANVFDILLEHPFDFVERCWLVGWANGFNIDSICFNAPLKVGGGEGSKRFQHRFNMFQRRWKWGGGEGGQTVSTSTPHVRVDVGAACFALWFKTRWNTPACLSHY